MYEGLGRRLEVGGSGDVGRGRMKDAGGWREEVRFRGKVGGLRRDDGGGRRDEEDSSALPLSYLLPLLYAHVSRQHAW
jgi:hypothetical protein